MNRHEAVIHYWVAICTSHFWILLCAALWIRGWHLESLLGLHILQGEAAMEWCSVVDEARVSGW